MGFLLAFLSAAKACLGVIVRLERSLEGVEMPVPEPLVVANPLQSGMHRSHVQTARVGASLDSALHQPGPFQNLDVLGGSSERHRERRGQFADRARPVRQGREHRAPRRVGEGMKHGTEVICVQFNHVV